MARQLVYSPEALSDLDSIFWFIAEESPVRARAYIARIEEACLRICHTPSMGVARPDLFPDLRILPLWRKIVVAYSLPPERVDILRVFSDGRDYEAIMRQT